MCLGNITKEYCGCYPMISSDAYREDISDEICSEEKVTCEKIAEALVLRNKSLLQACNFGGCPRPCKTINYKSYVTTRGWPSMYYTSALWKQYLNCDQPKRDGDARCNVNESNYKHSR
ncbi:hypothetical protein LOTGIDRAFT_162625 [Lottia gigantea]|uniref:Uncharacterized protein n=1 Tax=Lottia gigantea TaxID=225164 RepID=V4A6G2_LOTGI|nr:hypothetical protein LOTGIDRAFT_162625 [Lottia gigantea]ESO92322.1 hypothetical protein LOTGIDRAFT_162625 [Lottia gigantea]